MDAQYYVLRPEQPGLSKMLSALGSFAEAVERASLWRSYGWDVRVCLFEGGL